MEDQQSSGGPENILMPEFTRAEIEQLACLRRSYIEKEQKQMLEEQHRLEFARWLVLTGRLTDGFPIRRHKGFYSSHLSSGPGENQSNQ